MGNKYLIGGLLLGGGLGRGRGGGGGEGGGGGGGEYGRRQMQVYTT